MKTPAHWITGSTVTVALAIAVILDSAHIHPAAPTTSATIHAATLANHQPIPLADTTTTSDYYY